MSNYESNDDVQQVRVTTYRYLRRASRRGWAIPVEAEPSLADLVGERGSGGPEGR
ncbi:hypothetical protein ACQXVK_17220 [Curtobacterium sp. AB451]|uniref:hypothetical protein n=1 Tax=unclassified Curtobacterium TaxID=257496 RepID=UPI00034B849E|nr:hypothetical protein [Curtobacterium sp. B18]